MKLLILTDMEGIGGIFTTAQTQKKASATEDNYWLYQESRRLQTAEVNAAVQGTLDGGATEIVVWDGHSSGFNFLLEELHPGAEYSIGGGYRQWFPVDASYDAMALVGFHAMAGTPNAVLEHTQSYDVHFYSVNGIEMGEIGQAALLAGLYDVPVIFISSDDAGCAEAKKLLGNHVVGVSVKTGHGREGARLKAPARCRALIQAGMKEAMALIGRPETQPLKLDPPYVVVEETIAPRTHVQSKRELAQGRTNFITRHEFTSDTYHMDNIRKPHGPDE